MLKVMQHLQLPAYAAAVADLATPQPGHVLFGCVTTESTGKL